MMVTTIQTAEPAKLDLDLLKRTICKGSTDDEFRLFAMVCQRTGLDPFSRQIHAVKRWDGKQQREVMSIQTGIDGYRLIADRTGLYAGSDEPVYDSEEGKHPKKASVTVWKLVQGQRVAFTRSARWDEFVQTNSKGEVTRFWVKMPYLMLGKVAEALALRAAFPQELSGIYTHEEMQQAGDGDMAEPPAQNPVVPVIAAQSTTPKELPPKSEEKPVKPAVDYKALLESCKTLDELAARWNTIPTHLQREFVAVKNTLKLKLTPHSDEPPESDHSTGDDDPDTHQAYIGRDLAQNILDNLSALGIDWSEVSDDYGKAHGLSLIAGFTPMLGIKVTELLPSQGLALNNELKRRIAENRQQAAGKNAGKQAVTA